jgi:hypothetical protein
LDCGKTGIPLSNKGWCLTCAFERQKQAGKEMMEKKGPAWDAWMKSMAFMIQKEAKK